MNRWFGGFGRKALVGLFGVDRRTVTRWISAAGIYAYDPSEKRYLALGEDDPPTDVLKGLATAHGLFAVLTVDAALRGGEKGMLDCPVYDTSTLWKAPNTDFVRDFVSAIASRRTVRIEYNAKKRTLIGTFSPHRIVRTSLRLHVRGALAEPGLKPEFRDLVLTRFLDVRPGGKTEFIGPQGDNDWRTTLPLHFALIEDVGAELARSLAFEYDLTGGAMTIPRVPLAMMRYVEEEYLQRRYGDERRLVWRLAEKS